MVLEVGVCDVSFVKGGVLDFCKYVNGEKPETEKVVSVPDVACWSVVIVIDQN